MVLDAVVLFTVVFFTTVLLAVVLLEVVLVAVVLVAVAVAVAFSAAAASSNCCWAIFLFAASACAKAWRRGGCIVAAARAELLRGAMDCWLRFAVVEGGEGEASEDIQARSGLVEGKEESTQLGTRLRGYKTTKRGY